MAFTWQGERPTGRRRRRLGPGRCLRRVPGPRALSRVVACTPLRPRVASAPVGVGNDGLPVRRSWWWAAWQWLRAHSRWNAPTSRPGTVRSASGEPAPRTQRTARPPKAIAWQLTGPSLAGPRTLPLAGSAHSASPHGAPSQRLTTPPPARSFNRVPSPRATPSGLTLPAPATASQQSPGAAERLGTVRRPTEPGEPVQRAGTALFAADRRTAPSPAAESPWAPVTAGGPTATAPGTMPRSRLLTLVSPAQTWPEAEVAAPTPAPRPHSSQQGGAAGPEAQHGAGLARGALARVIPTAIPATPAALATGAGHSTDGGHATAHAPHPVHAAMKSWSPRPPAATSPSNASSGGTKPAQSAAQRWRAALHARPLEAPQRLPDPVLPWARTISRRTAPRFTAGPATSAALHATGAAAAASGDVVHLPVAPADHGPGRGLLAHELAHLRQPLARPRFLLHRRESTPDADELKAVHQAALARNDPLPHTLSAPPQSAASYVRSAETTTGPAHVAALPVATTAAVGLVEAARAAARKELSSLAGATDGAPDGATPEPTGWTVGQSAVSPANGPTAGLPTWAGHQRQPDRDDWQRPGASVDGDFPRAEAPAGPPTTATPDDTAGEPAVGPEGPPSSMSEPLMDAMLDALEQRLLQDLGRRGGRYAGLF